MRLPNAELAVIDAAKLSHYLLSRTHPRGRHKARFFASLGYEPTDWRRLEFDLRQHALHSPAVLTSSDRYGRRFTTRASLTGPNGRSATLVAAWVILHVEAVPRFVTAFPGDLP